MQIPSDVLNKAAQGLVAKTRETVANGLTEASYAVKQRFVEYAYTKLTPEGAGVYKEGLNVTTQAQPPALNVTIKGEVPNALEEGFPSFDMKPGLLASGNAKQGKTGRYVDVALKPKPSSLKELAQSVGAKSKTALASLVKTNTTIRRVSDNSKADSWIHPGFKGIQAVKNLADWVRSTALAKVREHLKKEGLL